MIRAKKNKISPTRLACFIALQCTFSLSHPACAREYFNPALLGIDGPGKDISDLSAFEEGVGQMPGTYRVDVLVNQTLTGTHDIEFSMQKDSHGQTSLQPCISMEMLRDFGVRTEQFPQLTGENHCANLAAIPNAATQFVFNKQQLLLSIPQAAMNNQARGYVAPERLDEGINALLLNYSFTGGNTQARHSDMTDSDSYYLNLRPGLNIGPWRVRNYSTWSRNTSGDNTQNNWDSAYTYAQRNIIALKSQLTLGESNSPSDLFDSVPFRGAQLASDDDMLPDSLRGYAPVVRGIARTNAQVIIKQNGYTIYQSYVSPGAFEITDMYPTGSSGDLDVTIKEADGSEQHQLVPFASLPVLQREGRLKYSLTAVSTVLTTAPSIKHSLLRARPSTACQQDLPPTAADSYRNIISRYLWGSVKTLVDWEPYPSMARRPGQPNRIRKKRSASQCGFVTVKTFSKRGPISPFRVIATQLQAITPCRKYSTPGGTVTGRTIPNAGVIVPRYCLTRISGKARGPSR